VSAAEHHTARAAAQRRHGRAGAAAGPAQCALQPEGADALPACRANGSIMREVEEGPLPNFKAHDGLQICHALLKTAVPLMRATGCPQITYADTIQHFGAHRLCVCACGPAK